MDQPPDQVECYSGAEYADQPRALYWQGVRLVIAEILQSWRTPTGKRFRVCTADGQGFELEYEIQNDVWRVVKK
jgi:hypothetical protein